LKTDKGVFIVAKTKFIIEKDICKILLGLFEKKGLTIQKIVIFGSFLKGIKKEDSDIDIIIVSKNFRDKGIFEKVELTSGIGNELVRKIQKPFDIMYYSDEEWEKGHSLIINAAKNEGELIYG